MLEQVRKPAGQMCAETGQAPGLRKSQDPGLFVLCLPTPTWDVDK